MPIPNQSPAHTQNALFDPGMLAVTPGIIRLAEKGLNIVPLLLRHLSGDWGDIPEEDKNENKFSIEFGYRLMSAYKTAFGKIWVITEADRSATTVLLPEEY
jgi:hypothetical protein